MPVGGLGAARRAKSTEAQQSATGTHLSATQQTRDAMLSGAAFYAGVEQMATSTVDATNSREWLLVMGGRGG